MSGMRRLTPWERKYVQLVAQGPIQTAQDGAAGPGSRQSCVLLMRGARAGVSGSRCGPRQHCQHLPRRCALLLQIANSCGAHVDEDEGGACRGGACVHG